MREGLAALKADPDRLERALAVAETVELAQVATHFHAGALDWIDALRPHVPDPYGYVDQIPPELARAVRADLAGLIRAADAVPAPLAEAVLLQMMSFSAAEPVAARYLPVLRQDCGLEPPPPPAPGPGAGALDVLIIGAGLSGIALARRLGLAGFTVRLIEKNDGVGGTWRENTYPGAGVDTPNHAYSFSFAPNPDWPDYYSRQDQLAAYLERVAAAHEVTARVRTRTQAERAVWDASAARWRVTVRDEEGGREEISAAILVAATGQLNRPALPDIPGLDRFAGPVFHTAAWDHSVPLEGRSVAMIGTGASAMQAGPAIASRVGRLAIFQRGRHWVLPVPHYHRTVPEDLRWLMASLPFYLPWYRFRLYWRTTEVMHPALRLAPGWDPAGPAYNQRSAELRELLIGHAREALRERPDLLEQVIPSYPPFARRILLDNRWFETLQRPNVDLFTAPIAAIEPEGPRTADGRLHPAEVLVLATGFQADRLILPLEVFGTAGRSLEATWDGDPRAWLGVALPDFPNFFMMYGPNTNVGIGNIIFNAECQAELIATTLERMAAHGARAAALRPEVFAEYNRRLDAEMAQLVYAHPAVSGWYKNRHGRVSANTPWRAIDYWHMTRAADPDAFVLA